MKHGVISVQKGGLDGEKKLSGTTLPEGVVRKKLNFLTTGVPACGVKTEAGAKNVKSGV